MTQRRPGLRRSWRYGLALLATACMAAPAQAADDLPNPHVEHVLEAPARSVELSDPPADGEPQTPPRSPLPPRSRDRPTGRHRPRSFRCPRSQKWASGPWLKSPTRPASRRLWTVRTRPRSAGSLAGVPTTDGADAGDHPVGPRGFLRAPEREEVEPAEGSDPPSGSGQRSPRPCTRLRPRGARRARPAAAHRSRARGHAHANRPPARALDPARPGASAGRSG